MLDSKTRFAKCRACGSGYLLFYEVLSEEMVRKREDERKRMEKEGSLGVAISEWLRSEWLRILPVTEKCGNIGAWGYGRHRNWAKEGEPRFTYLKANTRYALHRC